MYLKFKANFSFFACFLLHFGGNMAVYKLNSKKKTETKRNVKKIVGFSLICFASVVFLFLTGIVPAIQTFLLGIFGVFGYPLCVVLLIVGLALVNNRRYVMPKRYFICMILATFFLLCILQLAIVGGKNGLGFWAYMSKNYTAKWTAGGFLIGIFTTIFLYIANLIGAYIISAVGLVISVAILIDCLNSVRKDTKEAEPVSVLLKDKEKTVQVEPKQVEKMPEPETNVVLNGNLKEEAQKPLTARQILGLDKKRNSAYEYQTPPASQPKQEVKKEEPQTPKSLKQLILTPPTIDLDEYFKDIRKDSPQPEKNEIDQNVSKLKTQEPSYQVQSQMKFDREENFYNNSRFDDVQYYQPASRNVPNTQSTPQTNNENTTDEPKEDEFVADNNPIVSKPLQDVESSELVDQADEILQNAVEEEKQENADIYQDAQVEQDPEKNLLNRLPERENNGSFVRDGRMDFSRPSENQDNGRNFGRENLDRSLGRGEIKTQNFDSYMPKPAEKEEESHEPYEYEKPPLDFITTKSVDLSTLNDDVAEKRVLLENSLETFGVPAKVQGVVIGPAVTRYELEMPSGISVSKIKNRADDIALSLAAEGSIRIEAPVPGKSVVGVEVPNKSVATVSLKDILSSREFMESKSPLTFALGKDINGKIICCNLQKMPHLLIAGTTGSGKSVCLNSIILSIMYKASPEDVRIVLIDPKRVEFANYEGLPHLIMPKPVCETQKAINTLTWAVNEMERRFEVIGNARVKSIDEYNQLPEVLSGKIQKMPYLVVIVDEFSDLMMQAKKDVEEKICRLAQKARAAGIHLILATQRPSINTVSGAIKANFPSRIAFAVATQVDSMTILGLVGAEKLLGKGDMLYYPVGAQEPKRVQGCFITTGEINNIVDYVRDNNKPIFDRELEENILNPNQNNKQGGASINNEMDELLPTILKMFIDCGQASITLIRRRFAIGYARAARIIDQMEQLNYVSANDGVKGRTVYITEEQFKEIFGDQYN